MPERSFAISIVDDGAMVVGGAEDCRRCRCRCRCLRRLKCLPWMRLKVQCEARKAGLGFRVVALPVSQNGLDELSKTSKTQQQSVLGYFISTTTVCSFSRIMHTAIWMRLGIRFLELCHGQI